MTPAQPAVWGPRELDYAVHDLAVHWSAPSSQLFIACSSFIPEASNFVEVLSVGIEGRTEVQATRRLPHYYPPTRVRWLGGDVLATSGDCLRIWSANGELRRLLRHDANPQARCTPITSVDSSEPPSSTVTAGVQMASSDVYGVCALWDVETGTMQQAIDLGQPLSDVAFGPNRLLAAAGDNGDCFLMDTRQSKDVAAYAPAERVKGPAKIAWGVHRPDMFAVSWQGEGGSLALYSGAHRTKAMPRIVKSSSSTIASLQWSHAYPQLLACAREDGDVEVWNFPGEGLDLAATALEPSSHWAPRGRGASCTALAMTPEVRPGSHALVLSTMAAGQAAPQGPEAAAGSGSLWIVALPQPRAGHLGPVIADRNE
eukprot:symbB.v1.2.019393.t1/scaffold1549.1/size162750/3